MHGHIQKNPDVIASDLGEALLSGEITKLIHPLP